MERVSRPLSGCLCGTGSALQGRLSSAAAKPDVYEGDYCVTPRAFGTQTLSTAHKVLRDNVTVTPVPYFETDNLSGGVTAYIAVEMTQP